MSTQDMADRLRQARIAAGFTTATVAADRFGWNRNTYGSNENGYASFSFKKAKQYAKAFGVRVEWLYENSGPMKGATNDGMTRVVGRVGASPEGVVMFADADETGDLAPLPPGATDKAVALEVVGHSMKGFADDGGLIYFEDQHTSPPADMLGHVVVCELETGEVLVKRLLRGSGPGLYDLESIVGPTRRDAKVRWAAYVTAIIPPRQAQRVIQRAATVTQLRDHRQDVA